MRLITLEDVRDVYLKTIQRGIPFIFSKFNLSQNERTKSSFNTLQNKGSNWWEIPYVKQRWNLKITGDPEMNYERYVSQKYKDENWKMLSIGSGRCSHEMEFARLNPNWEITCMDFSDQLIEAAKKAAKDEGLHNMYFIVADIYLYELPQEKYDAILFHASLHHFKNIHEFLPRVKESLKDKGKLIINEYVGANRLQYPKFQIQEINNCLNLIDKEYRKMYKSNIYKNKYYGSGLIRMIVSDPSECVDSAEILTVIHQLFKTIEEKPYGGNLLMPVYKDIAYHFVELNDEKKKNLEATFRYEDDYLKTHSSDFVFGIYEKIET